MHDPVLPLLIQHAPRHMKVLTTEPLALQMASISSKMMMWRPLFMPHCGHNIETHPFQSQYLILTPVACCFVLFTILLFGGCCCCCCFLLLLLFHFAGLLLLWWWDFCAFLGGGSGFGERGVSSSCLFWCCQCFVLIFCLQKTEEFTDNTIY